MDETMPIIQRLILRLILIAAEGLCVSCAPVAPPTTRAAVASPALSADITSPDRNLYINETELVTAKINGLAAAARSDRWYDYGGQGQAGYPRYIIRWSATSGTFTDPYSFATTYTLPDYSSDDDHGSFDNQIYADAVELAPAVLKSSGDRPSPPPMRGDHRVTRFPYSPGWITHALSAADRSRSCDKAIDDLQNVIAKHANDPLTIQLKFRIAIMLSQRHATPIEPADDDRALQVLKEIIHQYDYANYYDEEQPGYADVPSALIPRAAILAGNILWARHGDGEAARAYLTVAMDDLAWSWEERRQDWLTAPRPKPIADNGFEQNVPQRNAGAIKQWEQHKLDAAAGKVTPDPYGQELMEAAVRQYGMSFGPQRGGDVVRHMFTIVSDFKGTPLATVAQEQIKRAAREFRLSDAQVSDLEHPTLMDKLGE
ncbi:MAG TPA: hypothetical protein VHY37_01840 [Tepidisphaeraceae bacterium]|nr:hypothetical protein [Tepidisphaeraceae bacterium]